MKTIEATQANFDGLIRTAGVVMIDFGAEWCAPCRAIAPVLSELAEKYRGQVTLATCDVEENNDITVKYSICNVPTILFFKNGELADQQVGAIAKEVIERKLTALL